ncbi:TIGR02444 family protein [Yunchengibacter salinarum]|uniref:TIGR02444 family protein n=1 Tax=Yunchengibacter salinarum TaxID=3133399 RepID=UPI0035B6AA24
MQTSGEINTGDSGKTISTEFFRDADAFWAHSLRLYDVPGVADRLIRAQDSTGMDVNMALLLGWLEGFGLEPAGDVFEALGAASRHWHKGILADVRARRRKMKGQPGYDVVKKQELKLERAAQKALIRALGGKAVKGTATLSQYLEALGLQADEARALHAHLITRP